MGECIVKINYLPEISFLDTQKFVGIAPSSRFSLLKKISQESHSTDAGRLCVPLGMG